MCFVDSLDIHECRDVIEIRDRITFDFHTGLPHIVNAVLYQVLDFRREGHNLCNRKVEGIRLQDQEKLMIPCTSI